MCRRNPSDNPNMISAFILGDKDTKTKRVMEREGVDEKTALKYDEEDG